MSDVIRGKGQHYVSLIVRVEMLAHILKTCFLQLLLPPVQADIFRTLKQVTFQHRQ